MTITPRRAGILATLGLGAVCCAGTTMSLSFLNRRIVRLAALAALVLAPSFGFAAAKAAKDDFMPFVELAPFIVKGEKLSIFVHARTKRDRRYAEDFAEEVVKVVSEGVTKETGKGLVIIGRKGEPHPSFVFRKFIALAEAGKLDPAVAARATELTSMLNHWEDTLGEENGNGIHIESDGDGEDIEFDKIITALPLPLEGLGAKLYQLAWTEGFDDAKVEARLKALHVADLEGSLFARFDWVFYLPPRGALEGAIDDIIADALKKEKLGFFERVAVKGAMLIVKPMIRKAIEGLRQGILFDTVVRARTPYDREEISTLTGAYLGVLMPDEKNKSGGTEHERAVKAVREQVEQLSRKAPAAEGGDLRPET
jgi:hypothetical protein